MKVIKLDPARCESCHTCEIACVLNHSESNDIDEAMANKQPMRQRILIVTKKGKAHAQVCVNCKKPKCMDACEYEAIERIEDGTVVLNEDKCTGCWKCIEACPFDAICALEEKEISIKCDLCGGGDYQACVDSCPTQALFVKVSE